MSQSRHERFSNWIGTSEDYPGEARKYWLASLVYPWVGAGMVLAVWAGVLSDPGDGWAWLVAGVGMTVVITTFFGGCFVLSRWLAKRSLR